MMFATRLCVSLLALFALGNAVGAWKPCAEINAALRMPCRCRVEQYGANGGSQTTAAFAIGMDCDRVVFPGENPPIPHGTPVIAYTQRHSGQQFIPTQVHIWRKEGGGSKMCKFVVVQSLYLQ